MAFTHGAETLELLVHEEPDVPEFVRSIVIKLPHDKEYVIESQAPRTDEPYSKRDLKRLDRRR